MPAVAGFVVLVVSSCDADLTGNALFLAWCAAMSRAFFGSARSYVLVGSEEITVCNWWRERRVPVVGARATTTTGFPGQRMGRIVAADGTVLRPICLYGRWLERGHVDAAIDHLNRLIAERSSRESAWEGHRDGGTT